MLFAISVNAVSPWAIIPFALLLLMIAVMPFIHKHWWEHNYPFVSILLGAISLSYYFLILKNYETIFHTAHEYVSFICLIGSLFIVAGGIHITVKGEATPFVNCIFLLIGAILANIIGTTGASMLMIRPWIRMNRYRITAFHIVFFIFIVSNVGGCLTPIGDPPLFLGYLKGIPFWWTTEHLWKEWATAIGILLFVFYIMDLKNFKRAPLEIRQKETAHETWQFQGLYNLIFLAIILIGVFQPSPWREGIMIMAAVASYLLTGKRIHQSNDFTFAPIKEVALLFIGIFATMMPALDYLQMHARGLGIASPTAFYYSSGLLSAVLDNAPTYLTFLSASIGLFISPEMIQQVQHLITTHGADINQVMGNHANEIINTYQTLEKYHPKLLATGYVPLDDIQIAYLLGNHHEYIVAISLGAVFFGAMTYIGNGPNFMVKSIAEQSKVEVPNFIHYISKYSLLILLPIFILIAWIFIPRS